MASTNLYLDILNKKQLTPEERAALRAEQVANTTTTETPKANVETVQSGIVGEVTLPTLKSETAPSNAVGNLSNQKPGVQTTPTVTVPSGVAGSANNLKSIDEIAREVIKGKWGNGADRKKRLTEAGYDYSAVQARVTALLNPAPAPAPSPETKPTESGSLAGEITLPVKKPENSPSDAVGNLSNQQTTTQTEPIIQTNNTTEQAVPLSIYEVAREVIKGKWGNGAVRKQNLINAGYDYSEVQRAVNLILSGQAVPEQTYGTGTPGDLAGEVTLPVKKPEDSAGANVGNLSNQKPTQDTPTVVAPDGSTKPLVPETPTATPPEKEETATKPTTSITPTMPTTGAQGSSGSSVSNQQLQSILSNLQSGYVQSDDVKAAYDKWNQHMENRPAEWNGGSYIDTLNNIIGQINNRDPFSYDVNADALYQMYRDMYMQNGKNAMMDTIGQASAMTGGYGNSYATTAGNQAYQGYLQQLNGVVPELYQLALNKYNAEGDALYDKASLYKSMYDQEYGEHLDTLDDWYTEGNRLANVYGMLADEEYEKYSDAFNQNLKLYQSMLNGSSGTGNGNTTVTGTKPSTGIDISSVPADILARLDELTASEDVETFLENQVNLGRLTYDQASDLLLQYDVLPLMERDWSMVTDGGWHWDWFGANPIDRDAVVKDSKGNEYKLIDLKKAVQNELRTQGEYDENTVEQMAEDYIVELQRRLGISSK